MPTDKPQALQVPATLMERLGIAVGQPAVVYLMGVHAQLYRGAAPLPAYQPGTPASAAPDWCPPRPGPGPCPPRPEPGPGPCPPSPPGPGMMMGTAVLNGILAFAGADYIDLHVPLTGVEFREALIPYNAIGMILPGGPVI